MGAGLLGRLQRRRRGRRFRRRLRRRLVGLTVHRFLGISERCNAARRIDHPAAWARCPGKRRSGKQLQPHGRLDGKYGNRQPGDDGNDAASRDRR